MGKTTDNVKDRQDGGRRGQEGRTKAKGKGIDDLTNQTQAIARSLQTRACIPLSCQEYTGLARPSRASQKGGGGRAHSCRASTVALWPPMFRLRGFSLSTCRSGRGLVFMCGVSSRWDAPGSHPSAQQAPHINTCMSVNTSLRRFLYTRTNNL